MYNSLHTYIWQYCVLSCILCLMLLSCSAAGVVVEGSAFLQSYGYLEFDLWYNEGALLLMTVLLLILAYVNLRLINKRKWTHSCCGWCDVNERVGVSSILQYLYGTVYCEVRILFLLVQVSVLFIILQFLLSFFYSFITFDFNQWSLAYANYMVWTLRYDLWCI